MKKTILCSLVSWLFPMLMLAQPFSFHADQLAWSDTTGHFFSIHADIDNLSSDSLHLRVIRSENNLPANPNWSSSMCNGTAFCYAPFVDEFTIPDGIFGSPPLAPGESVDFILDVTTDPLEPGTATVTVRVELLDNAAVFQELSFTITTVSSGLDERDDPLSGAFRLLPNYPNPFNPSTTIPFTVGGSRALDTRISVYNLLGQPVALLIDDKLLPGEYEVTWDALNSFGQPVPSGVYFCEMQSGDFRELRKLLLVR